MSDYTLNHVTIDGFRGLRNLRLENLGRINILVGKNNSGKTSVLEALSILCNPLEPMEWLTMIRRRDFGGLDESKIQSLKWCFPQFGKLADPDAMFEGGCRLKAEGKFFQVGLTIHCKEIEGEAAPREANGEPSAQGKIEWPSPERGAEIVHLLDPESRIPLFTDKQFNLIKATIWEHQRYVPKSRVSEYRRLGTETLTPYSYQINQLQVSLRSRLTFDPIIRAELEFVQDFDANILDIQVASLRGERPAIYLKHKQLGLAPLSIFGDALRRAILLSSTLGKLSPGGILLIDEIETGIHISALRKVFQWLRVWAKRLDVQVFATTHSLEAIDAMALTEAESPEELVTYHLEQTDEETKVKRIDGDLLLRLRQERGLDVR